MDPESDLQLGLPEGLERLHSQVLSRVDSSGFPDPRHPVPPTGDESDPVTACTANLGLVFLSLRGDGWAKRFLNFPFTLKSHVQSVDLQLGADLPCLRQGQLGSLFRRVGQDRAVLRVSYRGPFGLPYVERQKGRRQQTSCRNMSRSHGQEPGSP